MQRDSELYSPPVDDELTYDDPDPFFGEAEDEGEDDIESVDTLEATPEDVVDQHTPAYLPDDVVADEEID